MFLNHASNHRKTKTHGRSGLLVAGFLVLLSSLAAGGQAKYSVLYSFGTNLNDGRGPNGGLVFDASGNIYGTTGFGGSVCSEECGVAFELSPSNNGPWTETVIHSFGAQNDGASPRAGLIVDQSGNLYGTTVYGGTHDAGIVFELSPPSSGGEWTETILWNFGDGGPHDAGASYAKLARDYSGNLYGTTLAGGVGEGTVFEVSPSNGGWNEVVLYSFCTKPPSCSDGKQPLAGVTFDSLGNLYGTTSRGGGLEGNGAGVLYELSPSGDGTWSESVLHSFGEKTGGVPLSVVTFDNAGNLYGTVSQGGSEGCGGIFRVTPNGNGATAIVLPFDSSNGCNPQAGVFVSNLEKAAYGTTQTGGAFESGTAFQRTGSKLTILHSFCSQSSCEDGSLPASFLAPAAGKLYGTTYQGGSSSACGQLGCGVVFEIAP